MATRYVASTGTGAWVAIARSGAYPCPPPRGAEREKETPEGLSTSRIRRQGGLAARPPCGRILVGRRLRRPTVLTDSPPELQRETPDHECVRSARSSGRE